ncbi:MAG: hypothetical protein HWD92_01235 [Flavobacteriia bacterium]|nr:hypothetical protein [Flavobacteriia bacterium]
MTLFFVSCASDSERRLDEELVLINDVFMEIMGPEWTHEPPHSPPVLWPRDSSRTDSLNYIRDSTAYADKMERQSLKAPYLLLGITGALLPYEPLRTHMDTTSYKTGWRKLEQDLVKISEQRSFELSKLTEVGKYKIERITKETEDSLWHNSIGFLRFSRVAFSTGLDSAVFDYFFLCGGYCGHGGVVCAQKVDGKWEIVDWISSRVACRERQIERERLLTIAAGDYPYNPNGVRSARPWMLSEAGQFSFYD